jgi:hypothetical protein
MIAVEHNAEYTDFISVTGALGTHSPPQSCAQMARVKDMDAVRARVAGLSPVITQKDVRGARASAPSGGCAACEVRHGSSIATLAASEFHLDPDQSPHRRSTMASISRPVESR